MYHDGQFNDSRLAVVRAAAQWLYACIPITVHDEPLHGSGHGANYAVSSGGAGCVAPRCCLCCCAPQRLPTVTVTPAANTTLAAQVLACTAAAAGATVLNHAEVVKLLKVRLASWHA